MKSNILTKFFNRLIRQDYPTGVDLSTFKGCLKKSAIDFTFVSILLLPFLVFRYFSPQNQVAASIKMLFSLNILLVVFINILTLNTLLLFYRRRNK